MDQPGRPWSGTCMECSRLIITFGSAGARSYFERIEWQWVTDREGQRYGKKDRKGRLIRLTMGSPFFPWEIYLSLGKPDHYNVAEDGIIFLIA